MRVWKTADLPSKEQFAFWREVLCQAFTVLNPHIPRESRQGAFDSGVTKKELLGVSVTEVHSRAQVLVHGDPEIRRMPDDYFFLNMQACGSLTTLQDGRSTTVRPGECCLVDTTRPYELRYDDWRTLSLRIPRHVLLPKLKHPESVTALKLGDDGRMGTVITDFVRSLFALPEDLGSEAQGALVESLANLLGAAFNPRHAADQGARQHIREELRNSIVAYVKVHIGNPKLSTATVAHRFGISPRYLQKLFEDSDHTFAETLSMIRLHKIADELQAPSSRRRSISEIAYRWGYSDLSSFCRAFRRRYGMSARQLQQSGGRSVESATMTLPWPEGRPDRSGFS